MTDDIPDFSGDIPENIYNHSLGSRDNRYNINWEPEEIVSNPLNRKPLLLTYYPDLIKIYRETNATQRKRKVNRKLTKRMRGDKEQERE